VQIDIDPGSHRLGGAARPVPYAREPAYRYQQPARTRQEGLVEPSAQIPLERLPWFDRMLIAFGVIELILMVIGFWHAGTMG